MGTSLLLSCIHDCVTVIRLEKTFIYVLQNVNKDRIFTFMQNTRLYIFNFNCINNGGGRCILFSTFVRSSFRAIVTDIQVETTKIRKYDGEKSKQRNHDVENTKVFLNEWFIFQFWNRPFKTLQGYQDENLALVGQQYRAWSEYTDVQAGLVLYRWERLITQ